MRRKNSNYDIYLQVYPTSHIEKPNRQMFAQMFYVAGPYETNGWHERDEFGVNMYGSMTSNDKARMTVFVDTSTFNPAEGPDYNNWCERWVRI